MRLFGFEVDESINQLFQNIQELKQDLTPTPLPQGPAIWEEGKKRGDTIDDNFKNTAIDAATSLTPTGGVIGITKKSISPLIEDFFGMHKSTELGDIVLTKSAKDPSKFQMTFFDGKLGKSNTVKDLQFDTKEEAIKAFEELQ